MKKLLLCALLTTTVSFARDGRLSEEMERTLDLLDERAIEYQGRGIKDMHRLVDSLRALIEAERQLEADRARQERQKQQDAYAADQRERDAQLRNEAEARREKQALKEQKLRNEAEAEREERAARERDKEPTRRAQFAESAAMMAQAEKDRAEALREQAEAQRDIAKADEEARLAFKEENAERMAQANQKQQEEELRLAEQRELREAEWKHQQALAQVTREVELARKRIEEEARMLDSSSEEAMMKVEQVRALAKIHARVRAMQNPEIARAIAEAEQADREMRERMHQSALAAQMERLKAIGRGLWDFVGNKERLRNTALTIGAIIVLAYIAKRTTRVVADQVQRRFNTPALVQEWSPVTVPQRLARAMGLTTEGASVTLGDIVLTDAQREEATRLFKRMTTAAERNMTVNGVALVGPPGTGKTMLMQALAQSDERVVFAKISGGDIAPLLKNGLAVERIKETTDWLETHSTGRVPCLMVDEADSLFASRGGDDTSPERIDAVNALLGRTGNATSRIALVLATNRFDDLDAAVKDRLDGVVQMPVPGRDERVELLEKELTRMCAGGGVVRNADVDTGALADELDGVSARSIVHSLCRTAELDALGAADHRLSQAHLLAEAQRVHGEAQA